MNLSLVIPTLGRGQALLDTVEALSRLQPRPLELLLIDQTPRHDDGVDRELAALAAREEVRWIRLETPSIPGAMNRGLLEARGDIVLFLDDDILPAENLLGGHLSAHGAGRGEIIAGQVLQPGEEGEPLSGRSFAFRSTTAQEIETLMGGNFSIRRSIALQLRGFDESFVQVAYRFEADFADRARRAGCRIWFEPGAGIRHLKLPRGGTRSFGHHLTTARPSHAVGEYYYLLRQRPPGFLGRFAARPWRAVATRHHLARPWWIPATLCAEALGMLWAVALGLRRPRLLPETRFVEERSR